MKNIIFKTSVLWLLSQVLWSYPVYLRQVIYNHTPFEMYFGLRPYYQYPNWSCQGPIPAFSMKICHDQYDNENDYFLLQIIKSYQPAKLDHSITLRIPTLLYAPSAEMIWDIYYNSWNNDYQFNYRVQ
jgi:hypothetical protein